MAGLLAGMFPLIFILPYVRLLLDPSLEQTSKIWAALINGAGLALVLGYFLFWRNPYTPSRDESYWSDAVIVIIPASFIIASLALYARHRLSFAAGTIAAFFAWPYVAGLAYSSSGFPHFGDPRSTLQYVAAFFAAFILAIATLVVLLRPRLGYALGLAAAFLAWPYFVQREHSYPYHGNSWLAFNVPAFFFEIARYAELTILAVVPLIAVSALSLWRFLPSSWELRGRSVRDRTWPALALSFLAVATWFAMSVTPYRVPTEYSGRAEISILHVEKHGLYLKQTAVGFDRDGRIYVRRDVRRPLRYRSEGSSYVTFRSDETFPRIFSTAWSPAFRSLGTARKVPPKAWNSDTWYIYGVGRDVLIYGDADGTQPPHEFVNWFNQAQAMPLRSTTYFPSRDVCLGLCYNPMPLI